MSKRARVAAVLLALTVSLASGCAVKVAGAPAAKDADVPTPPEPTPVTTTAQPAPATNERGFLPTEIGKDGVSQKADFGLCTDATGVPDTFGPNQEHAFTLELEVPVSHGVLALQPGMVGESGSGGWEWTF